MNIYIDIETIPTQREDLKAMLADEVSHPANISKPETIEKWNKEKRPEAVDEAWRKTALNGTFGEVLAIGWAIDDEEPNCVIRKLGESEGALLTQFFNQIGHAVTHGGGRSTPASVTWIGHFITGFDLRFIWQRAVINGVRPPVVLPYDAKPWSKDVFDTKTAWTGASSYAGGGKLDTLCKVLGYAGKGDLDGAKIWDAVLNERYTDIAVYCKDDVEKTRILHRRMTFAVTP